MIATGLSMTRERSWLRLSVQVKQERFPFIAKRIWWRFPPEYAGLTRLSGDPLVAALLLPCMIRRERLVVEAPVSRQLLDALPRIQALYHRWFAEAKEIEVSVDEAGPRPAGTAVGCFFSGGVDSFYSLLKNDDLPAGHPDRLTHLLFVTGFDLPARETALTREVRGRLRRTAESAGCELVEISTNIRSLPDKVVPWPIYHGAAMAAVGLACGNFFRRVLIPSSYALEQLHPWGSHPDLDPLWSTENTLFVHYGAEVSRAGKIIELVERSALALEHLRVCWKNYGGQYNCGRCEKCLRTMIALHAATGAVSFPGFAAPLTLDAVRRLKLDSEGKLIFARENERLLAEADTDFGRALAGALRQAIERGQAALRAKTGK